MRHLATFSWPIYRHLNFELRHPIQVKNLFSTIFSFFLKIIYINIRIYKNSKVQEELFHMIIVFLDRFAYEGRKQLFLKKFYENALSHFSNFSNPKIYNKRITIYF